jgi:2,5-furandicarboxylate decarboxylase 1
MTAEVNDLRSFLGLLREHGQLNEIYAAVDPVHELGNVLRASEVAGRAAFFHTVKGHSIPVVGSALGSHERLALALGCTRQTLDDAVRRALDGPIPPEQVAEGACQEVVDGSPDLASLPVPVHAPEDAGPFVNAGVVIARDPVTGRHNLTYVRLQIYGPDQFGLNINPRFRHMRDFLDEADARGTPLPFCVAIGLDPAIMMAAAFRYDGDEYEIAGGLRGEPIPVVSARTADILVPARAEIVMECTTEGLDVRDEGPMAEFTGHYSGVRPQRVGRLCALTYRRDPIFQTIAGASAEHLLLGTALSHEPALKRLTRAISPRVRDVFMPPFGHGFSALVSVESPRVGEARSIGIAALQAHANIKVIIVLDTDIDIFDMRDVMWALSTRVRWDQNLIVIPSVIGNSLDPVADEHSLVTKVVIDATLKPEARDRFVRVRYPPVDLGSYLGQP